MAQPATEKAPRSPAQRLAALIEMAAEQPLEMQPLVRPPIRTEHELDRLIDEWEQERRAGPFKRGPRAAG